MFRINPQLIGMGKRLGGKDKTERLKGLSPHPSESTGARVVQEKYCGACSSLSALQFLHNLPIERLKC